MRVGQAWPLHLARSGRRSRCNEQRRLTTCRVSPATRSRQGDHRLGPTQPLCARRRQRSGWRHRADSHRRDSFAVSRQDRPALESRLLVGRSQGCRSMPRSHRWMWGSMIGPEYSPAMLKAPPLSLHRQAAALASALSLPDTVSRFAARMQHRCGDRRCDIFLTPSRTLTANDRHVDLPRWTGNVLVKIVIAGRCSGLRGAWGRLASAKRLGLGRRASQREN